MGTFSYTFSVASDVVTSIHGKIPPNMRKENFGKFESGAARILVRLHVMVGGNNSSSSHSKWTLVKK